MSAVNPNSSQPFSPTPGLSYNPNDPQYFDEAALAGELRRAFDLCHSCRLCFKYCQSFPTLFSAVDANDGDALTLEAEVARQVVDECFGCKLCYVNCPYTPGEGHEFQLDFPALMLRAKAQRVAREGVPLRERMLADPDRLGRQGTLLPVLSNAANKNRLFRVAMEKTLGVHRDKLLPDFVSPTFEQWFERRTDGRRESATGTQKVVLFFTCFVNWNNPQIGQDAVEVLERNDCRVAVPALACCGMPALDGGDIPSAQRQARRNVEILAPFVERGYAVVAINPTCSLMLKSEYPTLLDERYDANLAPRARAVAAATMDVCEFLFARRKAGQFDERFASRPAGSIAYHIPCHLKRQAIGYPAMQLMRRIPGVKVKPVDQCSGHDGTWAMKTEYFTLAMQNGRKAFDEMREVEAEVWASDCPLAAVQFEQATGRKPWHPVQVLARAYRADGFAGRIADRPTEEKLSPPAGGNDASGSTLG
ncbi:MAG: anaerobic glycerol-3-phosphate dehydrogenase subunit C [Pirellulales bacterium]|nr:anaerobic glycerol-3-phosphate dehydrogenase subunit C [Pirellulales bacterium]